MTHKSILNCSRIFTDPGSEYQVSTTLSSGISDTQNNDFTILVEDTTNFKQYGYLTINSETFYYSSKTKTTFLNVYRNINGLSNIQSHSIDSNVYQSFLAPNKANTIDKKLSGWYIDGYSNQASLRIYDAPVIQPGVIRYIEDLDNPSNSKFQGCLSFTDSGPLWQDFNATQGPAGETGGVQAVLQFNHISNNHTHNPTNSGEVIKSTNVDTVLAPIIEVRKLTRGTRIINFVEEETVEIETNDNSVIINPKQMPYTDDLTQTIINLKGVNNNKCYGKTQKIYVALGQTVNKGQVVRYTTSTNNMGTYLTVEPFIFDNNNIDFFTKFNTEEINMAFAGIALETVTSTSPNLSEVIICTEGICQIKITDNFQLSDFDHTNVQIEYMGRPCILNTDGYGFNTAEAIAPNTNYIEIGTFLETGNDIAVSNSFVMINLKPVFYESI